jgi:hypothetical protein
MEKPEKRVHLDDLGIEGRVILRWIIRKWDGGGDMDWIDLVQDRDSWPALVTAVMNFRFQNMQRIS